MSVKSMLAVGFLSMMVATGVVTTSDSVASDVQRVDVLERMGHGGSTYASSQSKPVQVGDCQVMGEEGRKVDATERIGAGGSTYSYSRSDIQTANR